jgi:outer membrane biosynthesis protein TonB
MSNYTRLIKSTLLLAAFGSISALALKVTALLLSALVLPALLTTALAILGLAGYHVFRQLLQSFQLREASVEAPATQELPAVLEVVEPIQPEAAPQQPVVVTKPRTVAQQPERLQSAKVYALFPKAVEAPEAKPSEESQPTEEPQPEDTTHRNVGEEETLAPATVEESSVELTPTGEAQPEAAEAIPAEGDTGPTLEAEDIVSQEELESLVQSGELTFTKMKQICRDLKLTGYGSIKNCKGYIAFLAQQNLRRSQLERVA